MKADEPGRRSGRRAQRWKFIREVEVRNSHGPGDDPGPGRAGGVSGAKGPDDFTRRAALRRILGGGVRDRRRAIETVEAYRALLRKKVRDLPFGVPVTCLPEPVSVIGAALIETVAASLLDVPRRTLRDAYASLAHFRGRDELAVVHCARFDADREDASPEADERMRRSLEIRRRWLDERAQREREFDARLS